MRVHKMNSERQKFPLPPPVHEFATQTYELPPPSPPWLRIYTSLLREDGAADYSATQPHITLIISHSTPRVKRQLVQLFAFFGKS